MHGGLRKCTWVGSGNLSRDPVPSAGAAGRQGHGDVSVWSSHSGQTQRLGP